MYHIVEFHADGGQMCVPGLRSFEDPEEASQFAEKERMRDEEGHTCSDSVKTYASETSLGNEGVIYPEIANIYVDASEFRQEKGIRNLGRRLLEKVF